jgi:protein ImuA
MRSALPPPKSATDLLMQRAETAGHKGESDAQPTLREVFSETVTDGAALAFMLAQLNPAKGPVLWVSDRLSRREAGVICMAGLDPAIDILRVDVSRSVDVLWAMEQGLGCATLGAVVGEVWGDPPALNFTASKRLALRSEAHAVPAWLIRRAGHANLSAARARWRLSSLASLPNADDMHAPGQPLWHAQLFRSRWGKPGDWVARAGDGGGDNGGLHLDHRVEGRPVHEARHG